MKHTIALLSVLLLVGTAIAIDSLNVRMIGRCDTANITFGVDVCGGHACVADYSAGLRVISVADPAHPYEVGHYDNPGATVCVPIIDTDYVYLPDAAPGVRVISIADPAHPTKVGFLSTPSQVGGAVVAGQYAYLPDGEELLVVSVADPVNPAIVASCDTSGTGVTDVAVSGDYAYVVDYIKEELQVISISDPLHPAEVGHCDLTGTFTRVAVSGSYVCVAGNTDGLRVISVADPANPAVVGSYVIPFIHDVTMDGDIAYLGAGDAGLRIISIADPAHPVEVGYYAQVGEATGVTLSGGYIYVAASFNGLLILQYYGSGVEESHEERAPNRKLMPTIVRGVLFLAKASNPQLQAASLLDATGRKVMSLLPGANDVRALAPGVYFVREAQAQAQAVRKVVVTR